ncbi:MAG: hypothetical protein KDB22_25905 [Planctomycetales bacterium]|nr:hypothetical protein [Planctomycetales bacterium]
MKVTQCRLVVVLALLLNLWVPPRRVRAHDFPAADAYSVRHFTSECFGPRDLAPEPPIRNQARTVCPLARCSSAYLTFNFYQDSLRQSLSTNQIAIRAGVRAAQTAWKQIWSPSPEAVNLVVNLPERAAPPSPKSPRTTATNGLYTSYQSGQRCCENYAPYDLDIINWRFGNFRSSLTKNPLRAEVQGEFEFHSREPSPSAQAIELTVAQDDLQDWFGSLQELECRLHAELAGLTTVSRLIKQFHAQQMHLTESLANALSQISDQWTLVSSDYPLPQLAGPSHVIYSDVSGVPFAIDSSLAREWSARRASHNENPLQYIQVHIVHSLSGSLEQVGQSLIELARSLRVDGNERLAESAGPAVH